MAGKCVPSRAVRRISRTTSKATLPQSVARFESLNGVVSTVYACFKTVMPSQEIVQLLTQLFHKIDADGNGASKPVRLDGDVRATNPAPRLQVTSASTSRLRRIRRWRRS